MKLIIKDTLVIRGQTALEIDREFKEILNESNN